LLGGGNGEDSEEFEDDIQVSTNDDDLNSGKLVFQFLERLAGLRR